MRAWVCVAACVVAAVGVASQGQRHTGSVDPNIRLGLLAEELGLPPVPGANPNGNPAVTREELRCDCLPVNQVCPFDRHGNPTGVGIRISNTRPLKDGQCPVNFNRCCGLRPVTGTPTGPGSNRRCGGRPSLPNYLQAVPPQAEFAEYPWMAVVLGPGNAYLGGGVLIRNQWVLTAAHKIPNARGLKVRLGDYDLSQPQDHPDFPHLELAVTNVIIHPGFNSETLVNDVALLQLESSVPVNQYPHIGLACLPEQRQKFEGQSQCFVSGWGKDVFDSSGQFQKILKEVDVPIVNNFACEHRLQQTRLGDVFRLDFDSFVCAGGIKGKDACSGDGGSPLVCPTPNGYTVVGLVAWGIGCAEGDVPGVYVNVANFVDFIEGYVGPLH